MCGFSKASTKAGCPNQLQGTGDHEGQYVSNMENATGDHEGQYVSNSTTGDHKGPPPHIPATLAPTKYGHDTHRSIVGAGVVWG